MTRLERHRRWRQMRHQDDYLLWYNKNNRFSLSSCIKEQFLTYE